MNNLTTYEACFWSLGGSQRKPTHAPREHKDSTQNGPSRGANHFPAVQTVKLYFINNYTLNSTLI